MVLISVILLAWSASIGQSQNTGTAQTPPKTGGNTPSGVLQDLPETKIEAAPAAKQEASKPEASNPVPVAQQKPQPIPPPAAEQNQAAQNQTVQNQPETPAPPMKAGPQVKTNPLKGKKGADKENGGAAKPTTNIEEARTVYRVGPLDILVVRVWGNANLSGTYDVRSDGLLSMQLIGEVKAAGLTVKELKEALSKRIIDAGQINPDVDVQVVRVNSKRYYVTGAVRKTGEFPLPEPITVLDAVILAGGTSEFAKPKDAYILRDGKKWGFNYKNLLTGKDMSQNYVIFPGDRIVVPGDN